MTNPDPYQDPYQQQPPQYPQYPQQQPQQPYQYPVSGAPQQYPPVSGVPQSYPPVSGVPQPYPPQPQGYGYGAPAGGYEVDPVTGLQFSDKSKLAAGLLQLIPGFCVAFGGIGRIYMGHTAIGIAQLVLGLVGWVCVFCLWWLVLPPFLILAPWLWSIVDGIIILAGKPLDAQGRPLRQ